MPIRTKKKLEYFLNVLAGKRGFLENQLPGITYHLPLRMIPGISQPCLIPIMFDPP